MTVIPSVRKIVADVGALLANPDDWIKGNWALNKDNKPVLSVSKTAVKFDLAGAFNRVYKDYPQEPETLAHWLMAREGFLRAIEHLHGEGWYSLLEFNDNPDVGHRHIMDIVHLLRDHLD